MYKHIFREKLYGTISSMKHLETNKESCPLCLSDYKVSALNQLINPINKEDCGHYYHELCSSNKWSDKTCDVCKNTQTLINQYTDQSKNEPSHSQEMASRVLQFGGLHIYIGAGCSSSPDIILFIIIYCQMIYPAP